MFLATNNRKSKQILNAWKLNIGQRNIFWLVDFFCAVYNAANAHSVTLISNLANLISASSGSLGFLHSSVYNSV